MTQTPGLRERKKQQTREALLAAGQRLFAEQGFDQTTTDQIAAEVDVSQRTLFRYFASKEDVALAPFTEMQERFIDEVRHRPADEPPMTALRMAVQRILAGLTGGDPDSRKRGRAVIGTVELVNATPSLLAENLRRTADRGERLAHLLADREGVDLDTDPRPRLAVTTFDGALRVAMFSHGDTTDADPVRIAAELERCLAVLPEIFGSWRR